MGPVVDVVACLGRALLLCGSCRNRVAATDHYDVPGVNRQPCPMRHVLRTGFGFAGVVILMGGSVFGGVGDSLMAQAAPLGAAIS